MKFRLPQAIVKLQNSDFVEASLNKNGIKIRAKESQFRQNLVDRFAMWIPLAADDLNIPGWSVGWYFQVPQVGSYLDRFWLQMTGYTQKSTLDTT